MTEAIQKIPEGWSVKKIEELGQVVTGSTPPMSNPDNYGGDICWATAKDFAGKYILDTAVHLSEKGKKFSRIVPNGSVLVTCIASIGLNAIAKTQMATNQQINSIIVNDENNNEFTYYQITKNVDLLKKYAGNSALPIISKSSFEKIRFLFPPLPEQEKIAEILGTWDTAIEKLTALIEQKKLLKKGLMQRLLTGKQRLPSFSAPWEKIAIRDFCDIKRGGSPRPIENYLTTSDDGLNWLKIGDISPDAKYIYKTESKIKKEGLSKTTLIHSGDFILSNSMSFGRPYIMRIEACIHDGWLALTNIKKDVSKEYLFYLLISSETQKKFEMCAAGSGVRNLNKDIVGEIRIKLPSLPEQKAIADILSKADEEIALLTRKLSALKEQKTGLMQKLLTGQIRVKVA